MKRYYIFFTPVFLTSCAGFAVPGMFYDPNPVEVCRTSFKTGNELLLPTVSVNEDIKDCRKIKSFMCTIDEEMNEEHINEMKRFAIKNSANAVEYTLTKVKGYSGFIDPKEVMLNRAEGKIYICKKE